jgi:apolipoprotein N-acyltransferase
MMMMRLRLFITTIVLSALLAVLSHPTVLFGVHFPDLGFLAWVAYLPLFGGLSSLGYRDRFKAAFLFGLLFYSGSMYWLYTAMHGFGNLSPGISVLVLLILVIVLSLYLAVIPLLSRFLESRLGLPLFWTLPLVWVSVEWMRTHWPLGGFPWSQVGYALAGFPAWIQIADLTGVYGVTALILWANLAGVEIFRFLKERKNGARFPLFRASFVAFLILGTYLYGVERNLGIGEKLQKAPKFKVGLLQGNIPQDEKWLFEKADEIIRIYQKMSHTVFLSGVDLAIWPESSFPYEVALDEPSQLKWVGSFPKDVIIGSVTYESKGRIPQDLLFAPPGTPIHNTTFLLHPDGGIEAAYHKQHLVPYGEYIPLKEILPFVRKLTAQIGEFERGTGYVLLTSDSVRMGPLICYEDIFPQIARNHVLIGADLLVNVSNDAWYGDSSALPQHLNFSVFRAVENRRSLVRSTNTGMTATIDPLGHVQKIIPPFQRETLIDEVAILKDLSFYTRGGDLFAFFCMTFTVVTLGWGILCRKN